MNGSQSLARALGGDVAGFDCPGTQVAVCPPYPYLCMVAELLAGSDVCLAAQDVSEHEPGAFTGAVAAKMLVDAGCSMVIVGHSERRGVFGESDAQVAAKFERAQAHGLVPILCVGETLAQREAGTTMAVVLAQLDAVIQRCGAAAMDAAVIAYEPVWAIGTGRTASPGQAQEVHAGLRGRLSEAGAAAADIRLLYGGSVKPDNAAELFAMADIDGGLIGGASLDAGSFLAICAAAGS